MPRRLTVDHGGRFLRCDGQSWFLFADTGWELFHRLGDDDAVLIIADRDAPAPG